MSADGKRVALAWVRGRRGKRGGQAVVVESMARSGRVRWREPPREASGCECLVCDPIDGAPIPCSALGSGSR